MNIALILAGGTGTRLGTDIPKQYIEVNKRPIISYCLEALEAHSDVDLIWIVADKMWHDFIRNIVGEKFGGFSEPGGNRQLSILNGLEDIHMNAGASDIVIIHDGVRPFLTEGMISRCLKACEGHEGAIPVLPMKDTVYLGEGGRIRSLLNREQVYAGQAPEAFRLGKYLEANRRLLPDNILKINGSTEPAILAGMDIVMVEGEETNFKITTKEDLERFQYFTKER